MKKTEYALSGAFQRRRLSELKEYFWMIIGPLVLSLVTIVSCLILYRHSLRVSYSQDERTKEQPQIGMFLHQWQSATLERMLELEKLQAQFQNERDSLKMTVKLEGKLLTNLVSKLDSMKMIAKAQDEFLIQLLRGSMLKIEMEDEHDTHSHNELDPVKTVEEIEECPANFRNERDSVREMEEEYEHVRHSPNELVSERTVKEADGRPSNFQNERDSVRNLAMRLEDRYLRFEQIINIMPTRVEEDEDEDDAQSIMDSVRTVEEEDERFSLLHNEGDPVMTIKMEDESVPHFQNAVDSVMINKQRLPLTLTEEIVDPWIPLSKCGDAGKTLLNLPGLMSRKRGKVK
jgi:hypothetical protein